MTCSRVERSSGSPPRLPKSLTVRVFWVVDMLDLLSCSVLLMTAGPGPEGEKAGLSRPRAARPEGLTLRPGRPRLQRPDACAAPETKGEPAWLGPGDPGGEISAPGGVPGCAPPANRSSRTEEKCLSERTVELDFHNPAAAAATLGVEGKRGRGRACPAAEGRRAWIRRGGLPFLTADVQRTAAMDRAVRIDRQREDPTRSVERIAVHVGPCGTRMQGANHVPIRERREGQDREKRTPICRGSCSNRSRTPAAVSTCP